MKTTIDLPDEMVQRLEAIAAQRRTTVSDLVLEGLDRVYRQKPTIAPPEGALRRLHEGYHLGEKLLSRDQAHER